MSKTKAFLLSVGIMLVVFLISAVTHVLSCVNHQLNGTEIFCTALCGIYFLIVSTWFWNRK